MQRNCGLVWTDIFKLSFKIEDLLKYQLTAKMAELHGILQFKNTSKSIKIYIFLGQYQKYKLYQKYKENLKIWGKKLSEKFHI